MYACKTASERSLRAPPTGARRSRLARDIPKEARRCLVPLARTAGEILGENVEILWPDRPASIPFFPRHARVDEIDGSVNRLVRLEVRSRLSTSVRGRTSRHQLRAQR